MKFHLKVGSRSSPLGLVQVEEVLGLLRNKGQELDAELIRFTTAGDRDKTTSLTANPGDNFFTDTLDEALLKGEIDIAIHSAKDLPKTLVAGLSIFALTQGLDDKDAWVGRCHWVDLPNGAKVGTSSLLRQTQVLKMRPDLQIVDIRGTIGERIELIKAGKIDGAIIAACALKRLGLAHEIKDILPWEGMALQGQLAIVGRSEDVDLAERVKSIDARRSYGKVSLVGAGPGDPELITVKGIKALEAADCVFYDYLADKQLLAYAPHAEHIYVGKRKGEHSMPQGELSRLLKAKALAGKRVVRLKGGDPLIFGRGAEEISYLRDYHIDVDVVPGVSSATGIPSVLGLPLTARGISSSVAFVSGHDECETKDKPNPIKIPDADTVVFLMGLSKLKFIVEALLKTNRPADLPMMIIANGTRPDERIIQSTLGEIEEIAATAHLKPPALIIAGKSIDLYRPRKQLRFLHCGTHPAVYQHLGRIIHFPMIEIKPVALNEAQKKKLWQDFEGADLIICTSTYAVDYFIEALLSIKPSVNFSQKYFAVIGKHTQESLEQFGIKPFIVAQDETAQGLYEAITSLIDVDEKRILFPRSNLPNPFLKDALTNKGALVAELAIYENSKPPKRDLPVLPIDGVIFTSPSTVKNFLNDYGTIPKSWRIIAKGPVTAKELESKGYQLCHSVTVD